jgi:protein-tyrosine-phosphatase
MAEGFARRYGSDVMEVVSAGLAPAPIVQPLTKKVMEEKNIKLDEQYPKNVLSVDITSFDIVVNMSGAKLPATLRADVREWKVVDPIGRPEEVYLEVRDQIEHLVMRLILELRREQRDSGNGPPPRRRSRRVIDSLK